MSRVSSGWTFFVKYLKKEKARLTFTKSDGPKVQSFESSKTSNFEVQFWNFRKRQTRRSPPPQSGR